MTRPHQPQARPARSPRGGFLPEIVITLSLLGIILALAVQMLATAAAHQRLGTQQAWALQEAVNLLDLINPAALDAPALAALEAKYQPRIAAELPDATLHIRLVDETDDSSTPAGLLGVQIKIAWGQAPSRPVIITTWLAPRPDSEELP
jgi:hypothetical protein